MHYTFPADHILSAEHIDFYNAHGYLHFKHFVSRQDAKLFVNEIGSVSKNLIARNISKVNGIPLKFGYDAAGSRIIQRLAFASEFSPVLSDFLKDRRLSALFSLLGRYEGRIGEQEKDGLVVNHYENTAQSNFRQLGWHTDSPRDLFLGSRIMPMLNVGLHLDDYPKENGGLRVLPGTHKQNLFSLFFRKRYYIDNTPDPREAGFDIEAGDLTIHNGKVWHRVQPSSFTGEKSRRRVMYIPIVTGEPRYKTAQSKTPFYHRVNQIQLPKFKFQL